MDKNIGDTENIILSILLGLIIAFLFKYIYKPSIKLVTT